MGAVNHPLDLWRQRRKLNKEELGAALGVDGATVSRYISGRRLPGPAIMVKIYVLTGGEIEPNHFYELPALETPAELDAVDPIELRGPNLGRGGP
jgi:transcriptional regulator with XRE-family HTH domain